MSLSLPLPSRLLRSRPLPPRLGLALKTYTAAVVRLAVVAAALSVAGCASDAEMRREREAYVRHVQAQQQAMAGERIREVELEADGLPSQTAPLANRRIEPDDPSEPFSPNYGRFNAGPPGTKPLAVPQRTTLAPSPDDAPARQRHVASY